MDSHKYKHDGGNLKHEYKDIKESEMVILGNDPSLKIILFTRPHTSLVEVKPFGYSTWPF